MINTDQRSAKYLRDDANPGECYRCGDEPQQIHHTSYIPEETIPLCTPCHGWVHSHKGGKLQPERDRPNNYESIRRRQERMMVDTNPDDWKQRGSKIDAGKKRSCADCGDRYTVGSMYPYRANYQALRRGKAHPFSRRGVEWYCFRCAGSLPPLSNVR